VQPRVCDPSPIERELYEVYSDSNENRYVFVLHTVIDFRLYLYVKNAYIHHSSMVIPLGHGLL
jgi:hypothetical protein